LFRHYTSRQAGVNVYKLSDGTYVQDYPTSENSNTNIPYPYDPNWAMGLGVISYAYDPVSNTVTEGVLSPYIVQIYYGGHSYTVSTAEAAALTAAGYGGDIH
jgi:hypothetical protein